MQEWQRDMARLTPREWRVLRLMAEGMMPLHIGERLGISAKTASQHMKRINLKLDMDNRVMLQKLLSTLNRQSSIAQTNLDVMVFPSKGRK